MKKIIITAFIASVFLCAFAKPTELFEVKDSVVNTHLVIPVGADGKFTMGTAEAGGVSKKLLYGYPYEGSTSHTTVRIDGTDYRFGGYDGSITDTLHRAGDALVVTWTYGDVDVTQRISIVEGPSTGLYDTGLIEYTIRVRAGTHSVGILLEMDTMIGYNDAAPISTAFGYVSTEQDFTAPSIPQFWQAYEESPTQSSEYLIGQGTLIGSGAVMPDRFCLGPWSTYDDVTWDYTSTGDPYGDSAVLLWWNPVTLSAGGTHHVATLYGVGGGSTVAGELALTVTAPMSIDTDSFGVFAPNPFEIIGLVTNTTSSTITSITATITLPAGLRLVSGESATKPVSPSSLAAGATASVSWRVIAETRTVATSLTYSISFSGGGYTNSINRTVHVPIGSEIAVDIEGVAVTVTAVDATEFPVVHAYCIVTDPTTHHSIVGLNETNFVVHEDGVRELPITVEMLAAGGRGGSVDVGVIFDVTGSMGSSITGMKNNTIAFAESLAASGLDYRLGLVTYLDEVEETHDFTADANEFKGWVTGLSAHGGGDTPENALDAIEHGVRNFSWRTGSQHIFILITDAPYHQDNSYTDLNTGELLDIVETVSGIIFVVGYNDAHEHALAESTGGVWFPIGSDFSEIIGKISDIITAQYIITYTTHNPIPDNRWRNVLVTANYEELNDTDDGRYWVGSATLFFEPETTYTRGGLSFCVEAVIAGITDLWETHFRVSYDNTKIAYDSTRAGEFLERGGNAPLTNFTAGANYIDVSVTRVAAGSAGVSGSGQIAKLCFHAVADNPTSRISFSDVILQNSDFDPLGATIDTFGYIVDLRSHSGDTTGGGTDSCMLCDFDCDGDIDTRDFVLLGTYWTPADSAHGDVGPASGRAPALIVTPDGTVSHHDLFTFGRMWNWFHSTVRGEYRIEPNEPYVFARVENGKLEIIGANMNRLSAAHLVVKFEESRTRVYNVDFGQNGLSGFYANANGTVDAACVVLAPQNGCDELFGMQLLAQLAFEGSSTFEIVSCELFDADGNAIEAEFLRASLPSEFTVGDVAPNPFNPAMSLTLAVPSRSNVEAQIFDASGRLVATLANGIFEAGVHTLSWNGANAATGVYSVRVVSGTKVFTRKAFLLK